MTRRLLALALLGPALWAAPAVAHHPAPASADCEGGRPVRSVSVPGCTHGADPVPSASALQARRAQAAGQVNCHGDGSSGHRVQAVYVVAADRPDRYAELLPQIEAWAADVSRRVRESAAATGGFREVAWVTSGCRLSVARVVVGAGADDSLGATADALAAQGLGRADRRYLMWVDSDVYCGIAYVDWLYARVDRPCFGYAELHELVHTFGAVDLSAPNSSGGWHCTDEYDEMCYSDDPFRPAMRYPCASSHAGLLDCNHDDYFHTAPRAGSFLGAHPAANSADVPFLVDVDGRPPVHLPSAPADYRGVRWSVRADNADDDLCVYVRDPDLRVRRRAFCVGYLGSREADVTGALLEVADGAGRARLELAATDRGGARAFGFRVTRDGAAVLDERDGQAGVSSSTRPLGLADPTTGWPAFYDRILDVDLNRPPTASITRSPASPADGQVVTLHSQAADPDGSIASTVWDLDGDGTADDAAGQSAQRAFPAGSHRVLVRVTDDRGATAEAVADFSVAPAPMSTPSPRPNPTPGATGTAITPPFSRNDDCEAERQALAALGRHLARDQRILGRRYRSLRRTHRQLSRAGWPSRASARYRRRLRAYDRLMRHVRALERSRISAERELSLCL